MTDRTTATPADRTPAPTSRERLLDAAAELFYRRGVHIGVEELCRTAGVSKRSMYQLFASKDEVVAAGLAHRAPGYRAGLLPPADDGRSPRERILYVFERVEEAAADPGYRGCPFLAAAVEVKSPEHPASLVARRVKSGLTAFFQREAERGGAREPALLARQLTVAFDGSGAWSVVRAEPLDGLALATAGALLDAAGLTG
jgi:AcrR family transcriptional regulator